jgi:hypothetical protein
MTLSRLLGKEPPKIPAGGRAYVSMDRGDGTEWSVRVDMGDGEKGMRLGPSFTRQVVAYSYLDWIEGVAETFEYPEGAA